MPTLSIRFTGGHYHATPWGKAQNEGAVEWPPSPWRVLRALIATGYADMAEVEKLVATESILKKPFDLETLNTAVGRELARGGGRV